MLQKQALKETSIDQSALIVRDRTLEHTCSTATELETINAMKRRALAFDFKACGFHAMNGYHADLFHCLQAPPLDCAGVSRAILRAEQLGPTSQRIATLKRYEHGPSLGSRDLESPVAPISEFSFVATTTTPINI